MKKLQVIFLIGVLAVTALVLVACGGTPETVQDTPTAEEEATREVEVPADATEAPAEPTEAPAAGDATAAPPPRRRR